MRNVTSHKPNSITPLIRFDSDVNKDLGPKAKAKAKAKDTGHKVKAKAKALGYQGQGQGQGLWSQGQGQGQGLGSQGQGQGQGLDMSKPITRSSADADNRLDTFSGQSRSTDMVPFHMFFYCAIVTLSLSLSFVSTIFVFKKFHDLEMGSKVTQGH